MVPKRSRRAFLKSASSLAFISSLSGRAFGQVRVPAADAALDALAGELEATNLKGVAFGRVVRPGQTDYAKIKYYNARFDCMRPTAFIRPAAPEGVQKIVAWAKANRRTFAIRGGGHSFEGKSSHPDIVIDMSHLTKLSHAADGALSVEAGVRLGDAYKLLAAKGRVLPAGTCPTVGITGHVLGGGIGDFLPIFGYAAQSLTEVTLVTFGGAVLTVDDQKILTRDGSPALPEAIDAPRLMTLLRGAGQGAFGVVTNMTFRTHDVRAMKLASFKLEGAEGVSAQQATAILQAWFQWREKLPKPMHTMVSSKLNLSRSGNGYGIDIGGLIAIPAGAKETVADVRRALDRLFQVAAFGSKSFTPTHTAASVVGTFLDDDETTNNRRRRLLYGSSSALSGALPLPAIQHLVRNLPGQVFASFYTAGGAARMRPETSLHPAEFLVEWTTYSPRADANAHRRIRTLNAEVVKIAGFKDQAFPNYPDNEAARDYFPNRDEVEQVRKLLDPDGLSTSSLLAEPLRARGDAGCR